VNGSSGGASSIDKIADEAGKPFGLVGNTVRMYLREYIKQGNKIVTSQRDCWAREQVLEEEDIKARCYISHATNVTSHMQHSAGGWIGLWMPWHWKWFGCMLVVHATTCS
jgi:hypothetical protein